MSRQSVFLLLVAMLSTLLPTTMADAADGATLARPGDIEIVYLDTGNGDTAVYRGTCGEVGILDVAAGAHTAVLALLAEWGARGRVRWIAAGHMHADHIGGIRRIAEATGAPVLHRGAPTYDSQTYRTLMDWVDGAADQGRQVRAGDEFQLCGNVDFDVLWPSDPAATTNENDRSLCLRITYGEFTKGSCGDLGATGETALASTLGDLDVWKVSHHGSTTSSSASFVNAIRPQVAVLTTGRNSYGHPSPTVTSRYTQVGTTLFQTADATGARVDGDITITAAADGTFSVTSTGGRTFSTTTTTPPPTTTPPAQPIAAACADAPRGRFTDVPSTNTHAPAIDCIGWWGVTQGTGHRLYNPGGDVRRDQMASFVARTIDLSGGTLPASPSDHFTDDNGNSHELRINQLAQLDVVGGVGGGRYGPERPVTRAQMASFLARAWEARTGAPLPAGASTFPDIAGDTHEANINAVAAAGLTGGTATGAYNPGGNVTRAQMGTFLARFLAKLVADGHAAYPPADPVMIPVEPAPPEQPPVEPPASACVDLNSATLDDLQLIVHIGPDRAQQIIDLRPWNSVDQMDRIDGIGPTRLADIKNEGVACVN